MEITTHKATEKDINTILRFMEDYYEIERKKFHKDTSQNAIKYVLEHNDIGSIWIIKCNNDSIGYYCLAYNFSFDIAGRDCFLDEMYIVQSHRKKGIGTKIIHSIATYLKTKDFKGIHLLVYNFNRPAYIFYHKNGFIIQDGTFMTKTL